MDKNRIRNLIFLLIGMATLMAFHLYSFSGMKGFDGIEYAYHAIKLNQGGLDLTDHHFAYRWGVIFPAAIFYNLFGISDLSSALPAMLASFFLLLLITSASQLTLEKPVFWPIVFFVLSPNILYYWDKLMPDIQVALGAMLAFWSRAAFIKSQNQKLGILTALGLIWALLAKATVVLILPIFLYLFIKDLVQKKAGNFWLVAIGSGLILLAAYLLSIYGLTGDPLMRVKRIFAKGYLNTCSYDQLEVKFLLKRIGYELIQIWGQNGNLLILLPSISAFLFLRKKLNHAQIYWLEIGLIGFLSANFMSISPTSYVPMCADERHFLFLVAPWALASGLVLPLIFREKKSLILLASLSLLLLFWTNGTVQWHYGLAVFSFLLALIPKEFKVGNHPYLYNLIAFSCCLLTSLLIIPVDYAIYLNDLTYRPQRKALFEWMDAQTEPSLVVTNAVQERIGNYYHGFDSSYHIQFREFDVLEKEWIEKVPQTFLLINAYNRFLSGMEWEDLPVYAREIPQVLEPVYVVDPSEMYALPDISWVQMPAPFWEDSLIYGKPQLQNEVLKNAEVVNPKQFAKGWELPASAFGYQNGRYWIRAKLLVRNMDQGQGNWQIHVDDSLGNNYQWKSAPLQHRTPVPGKWVNLQIDHIVDIPQDSSHLIKIRLWNDGPALFEVAQLKVSMAFVPNK